MSRRVTPRTTPTWRARPSAGGRADAGVEVGDRDRRRGGGGARPPRASVVVRGRSDATAPDEPGARTERSPRQARSRAGRGGRGRTSGRAEWDARAPAAARRDRPRHRRRRERERARRERARDGDRASDARLARDRPRDSRAAPRRRARGARRRGRPGRRHRPPRRRAPLGSAGGRGLQVLLGGDGSLVIPDAMSALPANTRVSRAPRGSHPARSSAVPPLVAVTPASRPPRPRGALRGSSPRAGAGVACPAAARVPPSLRRRAGRLGQRRGIARRVRALARRGAPAAAGPPPPTSATPTRARRLPARRRRDDVDARKPPSRPGPELGRRPARRVPAAPGARDVPRFPGDGPAGPRRARPPPHGRGRAGRARAVRRLRA